MESNKINSYVNFLYQPEVRQLLMKSLIWFDGTEFIAGTTDDYAYALSNQSISILNGFEYESLNKAQNIVEILNKSNVKKAAQDWKKNK